MAHKEYCFSFHKDKCVACHACETACKVHNGVESGCSWRQVKTLWSGNYPEVSSINISISCMHCIAPECMKICPEGAIRKNSNGFVSVNRELCSGCRQCLDACPVAVPQFGIDGKMQKCNFCISRLGKGENPACAETCPGGAIEIKIVETPEKIKNEKEMAAYFI